MSKEVFFDFARIDILAAADHHLFDAARDPVIAVAQPHGQVAGTQPTVLIDIAETGLSASEVSAALEQQGINIGAFSQTLLRAVTHLDVSTAHIEEAGQAFLDILNRLAPGPEAN